MEREGPDEQPRDRVVVTVDEWQRRRAAMEGRLRFPGFPAITRAARVRGAGAAETPHSPEPPDIIA
jgi:hypothetical protein